MMRAAFSAALILAATFAAADEIPEGDAAYGEYLSGECVTCHSANGSDDGIPSIIGWDVESFYWVLESYRSGERENKAMNLVTSRLSDEEMASLAIYFGGLE